MTKQQLLFKITCQLSDKEQGESFCHTFTDSLFLASHTYSRLLKQDRISFFDAQPKQIRHELYEIEYSLSKNSITLSTYSYYLSAEYLTHSELLSIYKSLKPHCTIRGKPI